VRIRRTSSETVLLCDYGFPLSSVSGGVSIFHFGLIEFRVFSARRLPDHPPLFPPWVPPSSSFRFRREYMARKLDLRFSPPSDPVEELKKRRALFRDLVPGPFRRRSRFSSLSLALSFSSFFLFSRAALVPFGDSKTRIVVLPPKTGRGPPFP